MTEKQPTKEIKEFWKWCGFGTTINDKGVNDKNKWWYPEPEFQRLWFLPPIDLNNLFEYGTPKAREAIGADELSKRMQGWINDVILCGINPEVSLFNLLDNIRQYGRR